MKDKMKGPHMDALFEGILSLQSKKECYDFFEDLCTVAELKSMELRFRVARMLEAGAAYNDIVRETGASTATISRVNRCLNYGQDGYKTVLKRQKG